MRIKLYTTQEAADLLCAKKNTLEIWRTQGKGPKFRKIEGLIRYAEVDLEDFIDAATRQSTSEALS